MKTVLNSTIRNIHCVGIGGAGMSGIAEILHQQGYWVSGSDLMQNHMTQYLQDLGIPIIFHHEPTPAILQADLIVYSSAIAQNHPTLMLAKDKSIPIVSRGEILGELIKTQYSVAVAGTHGKTSTVGLIAQIALEFLDPTILIGGYLNTIKSHACVGQSPYWIVEADESDASFLFVQPEIAVVTNIDEDHMQTYQNDFNQLLKAYHQFVAPKANASSNPGWAVLCYDDPVLQKHYLRSIKRTVVTYGLHEAAMIRAIDIIQLERELRFTIIRERLNQTPLHIKITLSGNHSVLNVLAAVAVATLLNIPSHVIHRSLEKYRGVARRFQILGEIAYHGKTISIIDDYGHHPKEISATLQALQSTWPKRRVFMIFQPHRYTRTQDLLEQFAHILAKQRKNLVLLPIYAAGETAVQDINSTLLAKAIEKLTGHAPSVASDQATLFNYLIHNIKVDDIVLFQGAGDITQIAHAFRNYLQNLYSA